jgi:hypothetical protein
MFYCCDPDGHSFYVQDQGAKTVSEVTPVIGTITMRDIEVTGAEAAFITAYGLPESPIELIDAENISVSFNPYAEPVKPLMMDNFPEFARKGLFLKNVKDVQLKNLTLVGSSDNEPDVENVAQLKTENVLFK